MVEQGEYVLRTATLNRDIELSVAFNRCFAPGQHIKMSMVFYAASNVDDCPFCGPFAVKTYEKLEYRAQ